MPSPKLVFIGAGNLASAIVRGLLDKKVSAPADLACTSKHGESARKLATDTGIAGAAMGAAATGTGAGAAAIGVASGATWETGAGICCGADRNCPASACNSVSEISPDVNRRARAMSPFAAAITAMLLRTRGILSADNPMFCMMSAACCA